MSPDALRSGVGGIKLHKNHCEALPRCLTDLRLLTLGSYSSVRLDGSHYCPLEQSLPPKRVQRHSKRKTRSLSHPTDEYVCDASQDSSIDRLRLLIKTVRQNSFLGRQVLYIKLPALLRDACKMELAQLLMACPNLRYVDLPGSFYEGDRSTDVIRSELWQNCPDLRLMRFLPGSGSHFSAMASGNRWTSLESLTIDGIRLDFDLFRVIVSSLPFLQSLVLKRLPDATDSIFAMGIGLPDFPALPTLELHDLPGISAEGVHRLLMSAYARERLTNLTLSNTGVSVTSLHKILASACALSSLTVIFDIESGLPLEPVAPLASLTLQTLHYEIRDVASGKSRTHPADSYHRYLLDSILTGNLPGLRALFVRDPSFPEALQNPVNVFSARNSMMSNRDSVNSLTQMTYPSSNPFSNQYPLHLPVNSPSRSPRMAAFPIVKQDPPAAGPNSSLQSDPFASNLPFGAPIPRRRPPPNQLRLLQPLEVFTKSQHDNIGEWLSRPLSPLQPPGVSPRPLSTFNIEWGAHARRSVMVTNTDGGFLALPGFEDEGGPRPRSNHSFLSVRNDFRRSQAWDERAGEVERDGDKKEKQRKSRLAPAKVDDLW